MAAAAAMLRAGRPSQNWILGEIERSGEIAGQEKDDESAAATIPLVLRSGLPRTIFSSAPLTWLGRISYGFYVFHILLEPLFDHLGAQIAHTSSGDYYHIVRACIAFVLTFLISWLSFHLFEMPILSLKRFFPLNASLPWGEPIHESPRSHRKHAHARY